MRINKDDQVLVLIGINSGKKSRVISVNKEKEKVTVEGVNVVHKHVRRSRRNPQGGRLSMEMPVSVSNVQLICPFCSQPTRVGFRFDGEGTKYRVCKKCKADINIVTKARKKIAK
ncbi:MAG: 50S ribosomal protein L24 [Planctomycetaceae bacterium]|jgi:large subunit ribosomal protein L24|nr:50S ribosomal protein L24 [Planctomycetaceae bacterium]MDR1268164.1 50S ribosomal protein L24 [Planctomycetaceae bacterium]